ncbi:unnamed protein product [Mytilus edulis]|uniref:Methyltransferase FkbM domain-containing protein n=1 Tax=Mytilus edulis TaxID=6550 RepID=A0A8S3SCP5_MYTED|nr:unnamed protein product [Mytilus edulis]
MCYKDLPRVQMVPVVLVLLFVCLYEVNYDQNSTKIPPMNTKEYNGLKSFTYEKKAYNKTETQPIQESDSVESIRKDCGKLCETNAKGVPGPYFDQITVPIDCQALFKNEHIDRGHGLSNAPKTIPKHLHMDFTMNKRLKVSPWYFNDGGYLGKTARLAVWTEQIIKEYISLAKDNKLKGTYGVSETNALRDGLKHAPGIMNGRVLVIGSEIPWVEACALEAGAREVVTLEYGKIVSKHPKIKTMIPDQYRKSYLNKTLGSFDAVVTFSSIEHSGLGRYGDGLNPWGDIIAIARGWCVTKKGGSLTIGVPYNYEMDYIKFNAEKNGFFVEMGAFNGQTYSNTLWLERKHNWTGLLIEANPDLCRQIDALKRQAWRLCSCISDTLNKTEFIQSGAVGGMASELDDDQMKMVKTKRTISVPCFNMIEILDLIGVQHIDYFSLDVEGSEMIILESIRNELISGKIVVNIWSIEYRTWDGKQNIISKSFQKLKNLRDFFENIGGYVEHSQLNNEDGDNRDEKDLSEMLCNKRLKRMLPGVLVVLFECIYKLNYDSSSKVPGVITQEKYPQESLDAVEYIRMDCEKLFETNAKGTGRLAVWTEQIIDDYMSLAKENKLKGNVWRIRNKCFTRCLKHAPGIMNGRVLVMASELPWVEVCALKQEHARLLEYGKIVSKHPKIKTIIADQFRKSYLNKTLRSFNAIVTFGSIEHFGLGRYGDGLNPWGDIIAIARGWCVTKEGGC